MATAAPLPQVEPAYSGSGVWSWLTTVDHKRIGILYGVTAFSFFLVGGLEALAIRAQLMRPEQQLVTGSAFNGLMTTTQLLSIVMVIAGGLLWMRMPRRQAGPATSAHA